jgi:uncharacterized protein
MTTRIFKLSKTPFEHWPSLARADKRVKGQQALLPDVTPAIDEDPRVALCRDLACSRGTVKPSHDLNHVQRVVALAQHLATVEGADGVVVACAAWLHDVHRGTEDAGGEDHAVAGARLTREVLGESPLFDGTTVEAVADAIAAHRYRSGPPPATVEAQCLYDADKLDALGAVGVGRAYMMAGEHGQRLHTVVEGSASARHVADIDHGAYSPVEEYTVKLRHLPGRMTTEEGRRMALARAEFMARFFERLEEEVSGRR